MDYEPISPLGEIVIKCSEAADFWAERSDLKITNQTMSDIYRNLAHIAQAIIKLSETK